MRRLVAGLAVIGAVLAPVSASASRAIASQPGQVVIIGVPGLSLAEPISELREFAGEGSLGALSIKAMGDVTCATAGWLTLGAGNRAAGPPGDPSTCSTGFGKLAVRTVGAGAQVDGFAELGRHNVTLTSGTRLGALGAAMGDHGHCIAAAGRGAAVAAADPSGSVSIYATDVREAGSRPGGLAEFLASCPITFIDAEGLEVPRLVAEVDAARSPTSTLLVVGVSEASSPTKPHLHLMLAHGPGFPDGWLSSASTGREPYVQLVDVAPTALATVGITAPNSMIGEPIQRVGSAASSDARLHRLADLDRLATTQHVLAPLVFAVIAIGQVATYLLGLALVRRARSRGDELGEKRLLRLGRVVAVAALASTGATFLANLVPWWRFSHPFACLLAIGLALTAGLVALAFSGPWRRHLIGPPTAAAAIVAGIIGVDLLTGAHLQIASIAGYSPLVAGRFAGLGNVAFGLFGAASLLAAAGLASALRQSGRTPRVAGVAVGVVGVLAIALDGGPWWGSDFGGVIALLPAFAFLGLVVAGVRLTWRRLLATGIATAAAVLGICLLDYARPQTSQTHLGRFAGQLLHGDAGTVLRRKAQANWDLLMHSPLTMAVPILIALAIAILLRPPAALQRTLEIPVLRDGLVAVLVMSVVGMAANDSGVAIPALAMMIVLPLTVAVAASTTKLASHTGRVESEQLRRVLP